MIATLPFSFARLTWTGGVLVLLVFWAAAFYSSMLLVHFAQSGTHACMQAGSACSKASEPAFQCQSGFALKLQAGLHQWRVTMRYCRYRDLARSIWGAPCRHTAASCHDGTSSSCVLHAG